VNVTATFVPFPRVTQVAAVLSGTTSGWSVQRNDADATWRASFSRGVQCSTPCRSSSILSSSDRGLLL
jgi:hypothetical protein